MSWITTEARSGIVNQAYSFQFQASSGQGSVSFTLQSGGLPPGLSLSSSGLLSGSPAQTGGFSYILRAHSGPSTFADRNFSMLVTGSLPPITFYPSSFPSGAMNTTYRGEFNAVGATGPVQFQIVSGALPPGLQMVATNQAGIAVVGTPTQAGSFNFVLRTTDSFGAVQTFNLSIVISGSALRILPETLPVGEAGVLYTFQLSATGGMPPYRFDKPQYSNYQVTSEGLLSLLPQLQNQQPITLKVTDSLGATADKVYQLQVIVGAIRVLGTALPDAFVGNSFDYDLFIQGGVGPYQCRLASGQMPLGLTLSSGCKISGTPEVPGSFSIPVAVRGTQPPEITTTLSLNIKRQSLSITTPEYQPLYYGTSLNIPFNITASGGTPPYQFRITSGALPLGVRLLTTGGLVGRVQSNDPTSVTVEVVDSSSLAASKQIRIDILNGYQQGPQFAYPTAYTAEAYNRRYALEIVDQVPPFRFSIVAGGLPAGLTMDETSRVQGVPLATGNSSFTLEVLDANGLRKRYPTWIYVSEGGMILNRIDKTLAIVRQSYEADFVIVSGKPPYRYELRQGTLPPGVSLTSDGGMRGTPTAAGTTEQKIRVTDSTGVQKDFVLTTTVRTGSLKFDTPSDLGVVSAGIPWQRRFPVSGGSGNYLFSFIDGVAPAGLDGNNGRMGGDTTTLAGKYEFTLAVSDQNRPGEGGAKKFQIEVLPGTNTSIPWELLLNTAKLAQPYSAKISMPGSAIYTMDESQAPEGLKLSSTGVLSGVPKRIGTYTFLVFHSRAEEPLLGRLVQVTLKVSLKGLSAAPIATVLRYKPVLREIRIEGGAGPFRSVAAQGTLPRGTSVTNDPSGQIYLSGTPSSLGIHQFSLTVIDGVGSSNIVDCEVEVADSTEPLTIDFSGLLPATLNQPYVGQIRASGGIPPYRFRFYYVSANPRLLADAKGRVEGTATSVGHFLLAADVTDATSNFAYKHGYLEVGQEPKPLSAGPIVPEPAVLQHTYRLGLAVEGGSPPYQLEVNRGTMPPGLALDFSGAVIGRPLSPGSYSFGVLIKDSEGRTATKDVSIQVEPPMRLAAGKVRTSYAYQLAYSRGVAPFQFELARGGVGGLPPGLRLEGDGRLSGIPLAAGEYQFILRVTDKQGAVSHSAASLEVTAPAPFAFLTRALPGGTVGLRYQQQLHLSGASGTVRIGLRDGSLPDGLTLGANGLLQGTALREGVFDFLVQAIEATGAEVTMAYQIVVAREGSPSLSALLNAGSYAGTAIAPGEVLTGFGELLGPAVLAALTLDGEQRVTRALSGTTVLANGVELPILYTQARQLSVVAPWNAEKEPALWIAVARDGKVSAPYKLPTVDAKPGLFTLDSSGVGQAAVLNQDGTLNSSLNPAKRLDTIVAYLTGGGANDVNGLPGAVATGVNRLRLPVSVTLGGVGAEVQYAGSAPGLIEGVTQLNVRVPAGVSPGLAAIRLKVGSVESLPGVVVVIQ